MVIQDQGVQRDERRLKQSHQRLSRVRHNLVNKGGHLRCNTSFISEDQMELSSPQIQQDSHLGASRAQDGQESLGFGAYIGHRSKNLKTQNDQRGEKA